MKNLANQAADATDRIAGGIGYVQGVSTQVVGALETIRGSVARMPNDGVSMAAALEGQSVVTRPMPGNMQDAAGTAGAVTQNILAISGSVATVIQAVETTETAAHALARRSRP